jgi:hypothetical protein
MNELESLCFFIAFLTGVAGGWELGGYRFTQRALDFFRGKMR